MKNELTLYKEALSDWEKSITYADLDGTCDTFPYYFETSQNMDVYDNETFEMTMPVLYNLIQGVKLEDGLSYKGRAQHALLLKEAIRQKHNEPLSGNRTVLIGDVLNGVLLTEGSIQYYLLGNIPPNGQHAIYGAIERQNILNVTEYQAVEC